ACVFRAISRRGGTGADSGFEIAAGASPLLFFSVTEAVSKSEVPEACTGVSVLVRLACVSVGGEIVLVCSGAGSTVCSTTVRGADAGTARYMVTTTGSRIITPKSALRLFQ